MEFKDCRSGKVVFVPHCALNQNARLAACAELPAAVEKLITGLMDRQIGIVQLPCAELMVIALDRDHVQIRSALSSRPAQAALREMARDVVYQIRQYRDAGMTVLGVLGKNGSPACGVETTSRPQGPCKGMGAFIEELVAELAEQGIDVPITGTMDAEPDAALAAVDGWSAG